MGTANSGFQPKAEGVGRLWAGPKGRCAKGALWGACGQGRRPGARSAVHRISMGFGAVHGLSMPEQSGGEVRKSLGRVERHEPNFMNRLFREIRRVGSLNLRRPTWELPGKNYLNITCNDRPPFRGTNHRSKEVQITVGRGINSRSDGGTNLRRWGYRFPLKTYKFTNHCG